VSFFDAQDVAGGGRADRVEPSLACTMSVWLGATATPDRVTVRGPYRVGPGQAPSASSRVAMAAVVPEELDQPSSFFTCHVTP
jgi:hypothetical protein